MTVLPPKKSEVTTKGLNFFVPCVLWTTDSRTEGHQNLPLLQYIVVNKTEIYFNDEKYKELILKDFGYYKVEKNMPSSFDKDKEYDVVIALGKDYKKVGETK